MPSRHRFSVSDERQSCRLLLLLQSYRYPCSYKVSCFDHKSNISLTYTSKYHHEYRNSDYLDYNGSCSQRANLRFQVRYQPHWGAIRDSLSYQQTKLCIRLLGYLTLLQCFFLYWSQSNYHHAPIKNNHNINNNENQDSIL